MQVKKQLKAVKPEDQKQIAGGHIGDRDGPKWHWLDGGVCTPETPAPY